MDLTDYKFICIKHFHNKLCVIVQNERKFYALHRVKNAYNVHQVKPNASNIVGTWQEQRFAAKNFTPLDTMLSENLLLFELPQAVRQKTHQRVLEELKSHLVAVQKAYVL